MYAVASSPAVVKGSLKISAMMGTVLNVVNQYDRVAAGEGLAMGGLVFNYVVPFLVATIGATLHACRTQDEQRPAP